MADMGVIRPRTGVLGRLPPAPPGTDQPFLRSDRHASFSRLAFRLFFQPGKVVRHSKKVVFQMAEVAVPRELFRSILQAIGRLRLSAAASG